MIRFEERFDEYAYRIASDYLDDSVDSVEEGQWLMYNDSGKLVISDGTKKSFLAIGSKRPGRNIVGGVPVKKIAFLHGVFKLVTDQYDDTKSYNPSTTPLKVGLTGLLEPWTTVTDAPELLVAYAKGEPTAEGFLTIFSA